MDKLKLEELKQVVKEVGHRDKLLFFSWPWKCVIGFL
jgi:hypothetical protein